MARVERILTVPAALAVLALAGSDAVAGGIRSHVPVAARARLDLRLVAGEGTAPWPWDAQSRSPLDESRLMADLTAGGERTGVLYLKGAADWRHADDPAGRVALTLEQGDYLYRVARGSGTLAARLFGDERRYFTGELGAATMEDDVVERFEHRLGATADAAHGVFGAGYLVSSLDDGRDERVLQRGAARVSSAYAHAALSYRHTSQPEGDDYALVQAEAAGYYRRASVFVSYAQSGFGSGAFFPSGEFDGGARDGGRYVAAAPENSAASAQARLSRFAVDDVHLDVSWRYRAAGSAYVNDLASARAGSVSNTVGVYASHARYAVDGRLVWRDETRFTLEASARRGVEATARAFLRDNSQLLLRGGAERREFRGREETDAGFVQGGYRRELQRFMGGIQTLVDGIGEDAKVRAGVEARVNWSATSAFYARWIVSDAIGRADALHARLEFRPTRRAWVTLAWGWSDAGDSPYMLDDPDPLSAHRTRDVVTLSVRGDF